MVCACINFGQDKIVAMVVLAARHVHPNAVPFRCLDAYVDFCVSEIFIAGLFYKGQVRPGKVSELSGLMCKLRLNIEITREFFSNGDFSQIAPGHVRPELSFVSLSGASVVCACHGIYSPKGVNT